MVEGLVEGLIRGSKLSWALIAALGLVTAALVAFRRGGAAGLFALLGATTATSIAALPLAAALAVPKLRWKNVVSPELAAPTGESWRRLRGPVVEVKGPVYDGGSPGKPGSAPIPPSRQPDLAIPVVDAAGRWVLFGLLDGGPVAGLPPAAPGKIDVGVPRICQSEDEACRPWPASWPDPSRPMTLGQSVWVREPSASALAVDVESRLYLREVIPPDEGSSGDAVLELVGHVTTAPPREGATALFIVRRFSGGRLTAMRVISAPSSGTTAFYLQRASVDLTLGRWVLRVFARPVLWVTSFALPLGVLAMVLAPMWMAVRRRRSGAGPESMVPSRRAVFAWMAPVVGAIATFAAGLAMAVPAVVAIASLWASR